MPKKSIFNRVTRVSGHFLATCDIGAAASSNYIPINSIMCTRVSQISDAYQFYRYTKLVWELGPVYLTGTATTSASYFYVASFSNEATLVPTAVTAANASQLNCAVSVGSITRQTSGSGGPCSIATHTRMVVPKSILIGNAPTKWYICRTSLENIAQTQGEIVVAATNTMESTTLARFWGILHYEMELCGESLDSVTIKSLTPPTVLAKSGASSSADPFVPSRQQESKARDKRDASDGEEEEKEMVLVKVPKQPKTGQK